MQGTNVVIEVNNINPSQVSSNTLRLMRDGYQDISYTSQRSLIDVDVSSDAFYNYQISTRYNSVIPFSLNIRNFNGTIYTSAVSSTFHVEPYINPQVIENGKFSLQSNKPTFINGIAKYTPYPWSGQSIVLTENVRSTNKTSKYLNGVDVSYNVILYNPKSGATIPPMITQQIPYLFKDFYKLSFYVATHVLAGSPFAYEEANRTIEYKIILSSNTETLFETSPILSNDNSWNKFEALFYFPSSYKEVTFTIQRNNFELNNLFLSDISLIGLGKIFQSQTPHTYFIRNEWKLPDPNPITTWKDIMPPDERLNGNVYCLSTNMSIGFWVYFHDSYAIQESQGIFVLGSGHPYIYIKDGSLHIDDNSESRIQSQLLQSDIKIPIYFNVSFYQKTVSLYKNGVLDCSATSSEYFTEAFPEDSIYIGTPSLKSVGYLMKNINLYDFPLLDSQVQNLYKTADYSQIGNFYDLSGHYITVDLSMNHSSLTDVSFNLNNGTGNALVLEKRIKLYNSSSFDLSLNVDSISLSQFSIAFWGKNLYGSFVFKDDNGESIMTLVCDSTSIIPSVNTSLAIPVRTNELQHFSWTFDFFGESKSYLNGYMYDISFENQRNNLNTCSRISFASRNILSTPKIGEINIFNKKLTQAEILTNYYNFYSLYSTYIDISGIYRIYVQVPDDITRDVSYTFGMVSGSMTGNYVDIRMSDLSLNTFNKNNETITFTLTDYNIFTHVNGHGNPYISIINGTTDISENTTIQVELLNITNDISYPFIIHENVDSNDISGGATTGFISRNHPVRITMKEDYKTEGEETFTFRITELGLATSLKVLDTTRNLLITHPYSYYWEGNIFVISLIIPDELDHITDFFYTIREGEEFVERVEDKNSKVFHRESNIIRQIDISFQVISPDAVQKFILNLSDFESEVTVVLNDLKRPLLTISETSVNEGDEVMVILKTPVSFANGTILPFIISGININSDDISCGNISYSSSNMSGYFVVQEALSSLTFKINPNNNYTEGRENVIFRLTDVSYNDISASVFIIDTSKPVSCRWIITDLFNRDITQINEGESFKVTLITSGLAVGTDIIYRITGVVPEDLSGDNTSLTGVFKVGNDMTRIIDLLNDNTSDGNKNMVFTTNFNDPTNILDVTASILINDTSQSPQYQTASTITKPKFGSIFRMAFEITNYLILTETQKNEQISFIATVVDNRDGNIITASAIDGRLSGRIISKNGILSSSGIMTHFFDYTCKTTEVSTFIFNIANTTSVLTLNS